MQDTLINGFAVMVALVIAALVIYRLFCWDERRHMRNCDKLDDERGGAWYYDKSNDMYCDAMTDRRVSAKGDKWL